MTLYTETAKYRFVDNGKEGKSVGDQDVFFDAILTDEAKTDRIGTDRVIAEYLPSNFVMVQLEYTIQGRGKIYAAGTLDFGESFLEGTGGISRSSAAPRSSRTWVAPSSFPSSTTRHSRTISTCSRNQDRTKWGRTPPPFALPVLLNWHGGNVAVLGEGWRPCLTPEGGRKVSPSRILMERWACTE